MIIEEKAIITAASATLLAIAGYVFKGLFGRVINNFDKRIAELEQEVNSLRTISATKESVNRVRTDDVARLEKDVKETDSKFHRILSDELNVMRLEMRAQATETNKRIDQIITLLVNRTRD